MQQTITTRKRLFTLVLSCFSSVFGYFVGYVFSSGSLLLLSFATPLNCVLVLSLASFHVVLFSFLSVF